MAEFITALKSELFLLRHNPGMQLTLALPSLIVATQLSIIKLSQTGQAVRDSLLGATELDPTSAGAAYGYFVDGLSTGLTLVVLILVTLSAYSFAHDRDCGAIRHPLICRISRGNMLLGKLLTLVIAGASAIAVLFVVTWLMSSLLWDFGPVVEDGFELISENEIRSEIILGLQLALLPLPTLLAFGMLISVIAHSTTQAVTMALGITLAMDIFKATLGEASQYIFFSYLPSLLDQSYLRDVGQIVRGYSDVLIDAQAVQLNQFLPIPELLLLTVIALFLVQKKKL